MRMFNKRVTNRKDNNNMYANVSNNIIREHKRNMNILSVTISKKLSTQMILTSKNTNTCQTPTSKNTTYTMTLTRDSLIYANVHCTKIPVIIVEYVFQKKSQFVKAQQEKIDKLSLQLTFFIIS